METKKKIVSIMELTGSHYEIGKKLGKEIDISGVVNPKKFDRKKVKEAEELFVRFCPGLVEELHGFADALDVPVEQLLFYSMTYLHPGCSQMAISALLTKEKMPLLARNYEFCDEVEDFTLLRTKAKGKYAHLGTSVLSFGREEGVNECGLAITMSSCGFPVGALEGMRKPKIVGLQYWAVIRTLLENCRDVEEALERLKDMKIAYNLNLLLADKAGTIALVETLDGNMAFRKIENDKEARYLCATNHPVLDELIPFEPRAMRHSLVRYHWLKEKLENAKTITPEDIKEMLLSHYPEGLCCHFYNEYFGTTKSIILNPVLKTLEICWGGLKENGWNCYQIEEPLKAEEREILLQIEPFQPDMGEILPLNLSK